MPCKKFRALQRLFYAPQTQCSGAGPAAWYQKFRRLDTRTKRWCYHQRWSRGHKARGHKARGQGQGHKKIRGHKDSLSEDRHSRGQGQECSRPRPRTQAQVLSKKKKKKKVITKIFQAVSKKKIKKKGLHINFSGNLHKKPFPKNFSTAPQNFNNSKNTAVLEPRTGQFSRT